LRWIRKLVHVADFEAVALGGELEEGVERVGAVAAGWGA
jgi:hypothetical protein